MASQGEIWDAAERIVATKRAWIKALDRASQITADDPRRAESDAKVRTLSMLLDGACAEMRRICRED
jgi:hypothetical protein